MTNRMTEGWKCWEVVGTEIYASVEELKANKPITEEPSAGQEIIVLHPFAWWCRVKVEKDSYGGLNGYDGHHTYPLKRCEDDRNCWVSVGCVNMDAVKKLDLGR